MSLNSVLLISLFCSCAVCIKFIGPAPRSRSIPRRRSQAGYAQTPLQQGAPQPTLTFRVPENVPLGSAVGNLFDALYNTNANTNTNMNTYQQQQQNRNQSQSQSQMQTQSAAQRQQHLRFALHSQYLSLNASSGAISTSRAIDREALEPTPMDRVLCPEPHRNTESSSSSGGGLQASSRRKGSECRVECELTAIPLQPSYQTNPGGGSGLRMWRVVLVVEDANEAPLWPLAVSVSGAGPRGGAGVGTGEGVGARIGDDKGAEVTLELLEGSHSFRVPAAFDLDAGPNGTLHYELLNVRPQRSSSSSSTSSSSSSFPSRSNSGSAPPSGAAALESGSKASNSASVSERVWRSVALRVLQVDEKSVTIAAEGLDREAFTNLTFELRAVDEGSPPLASLLTVYLHLLDVNDNPVRPLLGTRVLGKQRLSLTLILSY